MNNTQLKRVEPTHQPDNDETAGGFSLFRRKQNDIQPVNDPADQYADKNNLALRELHVTEKRKTSRLIFDEPEPAETKKPGKFRLFAGYLLIALIIGVPLRAVWAGTNDPWLIAAGINMVGMLSCLVPFFIVGGIGHVAHKRSGGVYREDVSYTVRRKYTKKRRNE